MTKDNRMDPMAKSPDPDDLTSLEPMPPSAQRAAALRLPPDGRENPDVSEPHLPPPEKRRVRVNETD